MLYYSYHVTPHNFTSKSFFNGKKFVSSVKKDNIQGIQFHPEKSRKHGIEIYKNLKQNLNNKK